MLLSSHFVVLRDPNFKSIKAHCVVVVLVVVVVVVVYFALFCFVIVCNLK
jgi:hypothetical protein